MSFMKMFAALLVAGGAIQTLATQARAETPAKIESSIGVKTDGCGWKHPYHYRYHYRHRLYIPGLHPRAPHPRRKVNPND